MRYPNPIVGLIAILLIAPVARGIELTPAQELERIKAELQAASHAVDSARKPGVTEEAKKAALDMFKAQAAVHARRALTLAKGNPDAPEAIDSLIWILESTATSKECDAAYDLLTERYLDSDVLLPFIRTSWMLGHFNTHAESFFRGAIERSRNRKVAALSCFTLGRYWQEFAWVVRDLNHPIRDKRMETYLDPATVLRLRSMSQEDLEHQAEVLFERTVKEFADVRAIEGFPPLGEQAKGALFLMHKLAIGRVVPEIDCEDIDGKPMKLSDYRGKVVIIAFWATWCGPCMARVPAENALVERMKGRPFVLIGVNGDEDRAKAKSVAAKEGMTWRSFRDGGREQGTAVKWGVSGWPTVYLIDAQGIIRDDCLVDHPLEVAAEKMVAEVERATKAP